MRMPALTTCQLNPLKQTAQREMQEEYWLVLYPGEGRAGGNKEMSKKPKQWRKGMFFYLLWARLLRRKNVMMIFFLLFISETSASKKEGFFLLQFMETKAFMNYIVAQGVKSTSQLKLSHVTHDIWSSHSLHPSYHSSWLCSIKSFQGQKGAVCFKFIKSKIVQLGYARRQPKFQLRIVKQ